MHIVKVTQSKDSVLRITYCKLQSEHFGCSQLFRANGSVCKMLNINLSHSTTEDILATSALLFTKNVCRGPNLVKNQVIIAFSVCYHYQRTNIDPCSTVWRWQSCQCRALSQGCLRPCSWGSSAWPCHSLNIMLPNTFPQQDFFCLLGM